MGRPCSKHCVNWKPYWIHVGKPERKTRVGRPGYRWKDNIKINLTRFGMGVVSNGLIWLGIGSSAWLL
jgi:hypothetical protein